MCVEAKRSALFSRASFLAAASAAAAPFLTPKLCHAEVSKDGRGIEATLTVPRNLAAANTRAARIAAQSPLIRARYAQVLDLVHSIGDAKLRENVMDLIRDPAPRYARKYATPQSRSALRDRLAQQGFVKPDAAIAGVFPPNTERAGLVQPFWSAPGSDLNSHHSYPGGLLMHEFFNSTMAANFAHTYDAIYFDNARAVNRDTVIAAALYHDIMKTVVFQFNDDGTLTGELSIAGTGGHHCLSGAEAIARGHDARFVTVLLSAHAAPSLGDEQKVVTWCRAAAMIAGVDPIEFGLVKKTADGYVLAALPPAESFVSNLSDHDYVLTIPAVREVQARIRAVNSSLWYRHEILAKHSAVALYQTLATQGEAALKKRLLSYTAPTIAT
jgi:23S rRNA maturation-related 3'-5' exoribonuclease YhaM